MKKWMMGLLCVLLFSGCMTKTETQFKEYDVPQGEHKMIELMNVPVDMTEYQGFTDENHIFRRTTMKESFRLVDEGATGILYFGYNTCPYCLKVVPILNDLAKKYGQMVYYIDVFNEQDTISDADIERYLDVYVDFLEKEDGEPVFYVPQVFVIVN
ncbi:MAG: conjugal transfer protein TraF, partial [Erysipelotrichaceae bacterium]|nr:conjugal transfer protein TraF [Erysipelotrichaceae bacterium]